MRERKYNNTLGRRGEDIAAALLREKSYLVLERNLRTSHREIDIICTDGRDLRFVEVKTRREPVEGAPWEAVNARKQENLIRAANGYLRGEKCRNLPFRIGECHFDVVSIVFDVLGKNYSVEYIPDAFIPGCV